jgi:hypothetical protein
MGPNTLKTNQKVLFSHILAMNQNLVFIVKTPNLIKKTVSLLCVKTKSGAHKQLTY